MRVVSLIAVIVFTLNSALSAQTTSTSGRTPVTPTAMERSPLIAGTACATSIRDQAKPDVCIEANSTPTLGMLYPYPGLNNVFTPQAFVGGGESDRRANDGTYLVEGRYGCVTVGIRARA